MAAKLSGVTAPMAFRTGEGGCLGGILAGTLSQRTGDEAVGADAKEVAHHGQGHEKGKAQRQRRHLRGVVGVANEEGVRQIVQQGHHLAEDGGDGKLCHRLRHGQV